jgi:hypothetical protein
VTVLRKAVGAQSTPTLKFGVAAAAASCMGYLKNAICFTVRNAAKPGA